MMQSGNLRTQVFKVLASQGWVPVAEETPDLLKRGIDLGEGFRLVTENEVEAFGVFPVRSTPHEQFCLRTL